MKKLLLLSLIILSGCSSIHIGNPQNYENIIEHSILWKGQNNQPWPPKAMRQLVNDKSVFEKQGNFYKPKKKMYLFGHEVTHVGIIGMNEMGGPNAHLKGNAIDVASNITKRYGLEFTKYKDAYLVDIKQDRFTKREIFIIIYEPKSGHSSIAGGYISTVR